MAEKTIVYRAKNLNEIQIFLKNHAKIVPVAGCTELLHNQNTEKLSLPQYLLALDNIPELSAITKTERYIDIGATTSLQSILSRGRKNIPSTLYDAIATAAIPSIRSVATIGGNIAQANPLNSCTVPLIALDAKIEVRTPKEIEWLPSSKYCDGGMQEYRNIPHVITKIRLDTDPWSWTHYARLGNRSVINQDTAYFIFLLRIQKNLITDSRLIFSASHIIRKREFENILTGRTLPIKEIPAIMLNAETHFTPENFESEYHRVCFFNLLQQCLLELV